MPLKRAIFEGDRFRGFEKGEVVKKRCNVGKMDLRSKSSFLGASAFKLGSNMHSRGVKKRKRKGTCNGRDKGGKSWLVEKGKELLGVCANEFVEESRQTGVKDVSSDTWADEHHSTESVGSKIMVSRRIPKEASDVEPLNNELEDESTFRGNINPPLSPCIDYSNPFET